VVVLKTNVASFSHLGEELGGVVEVPAAPRPILEQFRPPANRSNPL
jgi:hypothetical protein